MTSRALTCTTGLLYHLGGVPVAGGALCGLELGGGKWYFVDPTHGTAGGDGVTPERACSSLETMYGQLRDGYNDGIIFIGGATANTLVAAITWSKSYAHLIGISSPLPGMGQRCRVVGSAASDLTPLITVSGNGCVFKNIQFFNGKDADTDSGAVIVSGSRNAFLNCFIAGMGHATPAARAGSYSLTLSGSENLFQDCTIGLDTIIRGAANSEVIISGTRNRFVHCEIRSYSETSGKFLVKIDNSAGDLRDTIFDSCLFYNYTANWATGITDAFDMPAAGSTHFVILRGDCLFVGVGTGIADTVTHVYGAGAAPNAGMFVATNPTT